MRETDSHLLLLKLVLEATKSFSVLKGFFFLTGLNTELKTSFRELRNVLVNSCRCGFPNHLCCVLRVAVQYNIMLMFIVLAQV